jgi:hypothetical protein
MSGLLLIVPVMDDMNTPGGEPALTPGGPRRDRAAYDAPARSVEAILDALDATVCGAQVYEPMFRRRLGLPTRTDDTTLRDRAEQRREFQRELRDLLTVTVPGSFTPIVPPVYYDDRARKAASKHGRCPLCGLGKDLELDHCQDHHWCRGSVCSSCNRIMVEVDSGRRSTPRYHEWRRRCMDCDAEMGRSSHTA